MYHVNMTIPCMFYIPKSVYYGFTATIHIFIQIDISMSIDVSIESLILDVVGPKVNTPSGAGKLSFRDKAKSIATKFNLMGVSVLHLLNRIS